MTVRAEGYASSVVTFAGADRGKLARGEGEIVLEQGEPVEIAFHLPPTGEWPKGLQPLVYLDSQKLVVQRTWQSTSRRADAEQLDLNLLGPVRRRRAR